MYFDPLSTWLVVLIADGVIASSERFGGSSAQAEYDRERIKRGNEWLNADIRRIKKDYGLILPESAYEQIQLRIRTTKNSIAFKYANGEIVIDLDNQEYIISVLEECAKRFEKYEAVEEYRKKAEWYKNAAIEARRRKELYVKEVEVALVNEQLARQKVKTTSNVLGIVGIAVIVAFIIFLVS